VYAGSTILRQKAISWCVAVVSSEALSRVLPLAVPAAPGIQKLDPVDVGEIPVLLGARLFVVPRLLALPTFEINAVRAAVRPPGCPARNRHLPPHPIDSACCNK
jgi:hypothetical protein